MARRMGISEQEAVEFSLGFDVAYPEIPAWQDGLRRQTMAGHKIVTRFGRYRTFPFTGNPSLDEATDRQRKNFPIQATASDLNLWMVWELHQEFKRRKWYGKEVRQFNVVHDSSALEIIEEVWEEVTVVSKGLLENRALLPFDFPAPLRTSETIGRDAGLMLDEDNLIDYKGMSVTSDLLPSGWAVLIDPARGNKKVAYKL